MNQTRAIVVGIIIIAILIIILSVNEPIKELDKKIQLEEKPIIKIFCKNNTTEILIPQDERYNEILSESMKITNSITDEQVSLIIPEEIKNERILENYVRLTFSKPLHLQIKNGNISTQEIIIMLSGRDKNLIFINTGENWNTRYQEETANGLVSLSGCNKNKL